MSSTKETCGFTDNAEEMTKVLAELENGEKAALSLENRLTALEDKINKILSTLDHVPDLVAQLDAEADKEPDGELDEILNQKADKTS